MIVDVLGTGSDTVIAVLAVAAWFVVMRFVLPKLGVST
jgi:hypothetical protein